MAAGAARPQGAASGCASLTAGQALGDLTGTDREAALALMVVLVGAFLLLFGLLGLGRLTRFVSYSVMTGFLMGVGALIVLSQVPNVTGYAAEGGNATTKFFDLLANLDEVHPASLGLALLTLVLAVWLPRTRLGNFGILAALVVSSALAALLGLDRVRTVSDVGTITAAFPSLQLPSLFGGLGVVSGAFSVAVIVAVQAAGVSQNVPNPGGSRASTSRDFAAMGVADVVSGLVRGLPVGGSLSATALSLLAGSGSRWTACFAGVFMAVIVIGFPWAVSPIVMPALGALLMLAGARTLRPAEAVSIWRTGWTSRIAIVTTFLAMLFLPIQAAVGIGVALSALLYLTQSAADVSLLQRVERADGSIEESSAPARLSSDAATVLHVYGNLFYAGARTLERQLPLPRGASHPVVILRLRGRRHVGATLLDVLARYAEALRDVNGRLFLSELNKSAHEEIVRSRKLDLDGAVRAYETTAIVGESTREALADARAWLASLSREGYGAQNAR
jgi:SulP family sulfate permease